MYYKIIFLCEGGDTARDKSQIKKQGLSLAKSRQGYHPKEHHE